MMAYCFLINQHIQMVTGYFHFGILIHLSECITLPSGKWNLSGIENLMVVARSFSKLILPISLMEAISLR